jgi:ferrous iron transport protein B
VSGTAPRVLLAGNPNSGKTTLFNALTGARAKVGNYPGVTVERRHAHASLGGGEIEVVDLPGTYSLSASSPEEQVAIDALLGGENAQAVVVVTDATALARGLYLALQVVETGVPAVVALNMMDEARAAGTRIDVAGLAARVGVPVVAMSAAHAEGLGELGSAVRGVLGRVARPPALLPEPLASDVAEVEAAIESQEHSASLRARSRWALLSVSDLPEGTIGADELVAVPSNVRQAVARVRARAAAAGRDLDLELVSERYTTIDAAVAACVTTTPRSGKSKTERVDGVVTHKVLGFLIFALVMLVVFQALFSWSAPAMDWIGDQMASLQGLVHTHLGAGPLRDLIEQGLIAGVGNVLTFVPQIALLFVFIGLLEDSGYLARVAFVIDRVMSRIGLHGKAFVPMLSGYACAIPAVMATRTIESRRDRLLTMLVIPLSSCSARLPVYVLVTATVFGTAKVGFLSAGALVLMAMYALSTVGALGAAAVLRRTVLRGPRPTLVLELPPYRWPVWKNLLVTVWQKVRAFVIQAGTIILALTIVLWALMTYPRSDKITADAAARRASVTHTMPPGELRDAELERIDDREAGEQLRQSIAGRLGHAIEPVFAPLGFDWRVDIGLLGAFAAREVFVSTMGVVFDVGQADEDSQPVRHALAEARRPDGSVLMTPLSGVALMVFFVFACQCMSTLAVVRRESGSWKWPFFMFGYMTALAYLVTLLVYQGGRMLGLA